ncbi:MAG: type II toxin-antitoxin system PemK/MazF family toxin [Pyrinomonadaceae bacterium]
MAILLFCHSPKPIYRPESVARQSSSELTGDDLILCQITSRARHHDGYSIPLTSADFEHGRLNIDSYIRANRLFTVDRSVILYVAAKINVKKLNEARAKIRELFK